MRHRRTRRFRPRSNGRNHRPRSIGSDQVRMGSSPFSNGRIRNNFVSPQGAVKLIEKYQNLAKEALSSGDRVLSENYYQHADHFMRIADEKNLNTNQNKFQNNEASKVTENSQTQNAEINKSENIVKEEKK